MTQYAILTDVNRCIGCLACSTACKAINGVPIGSFWNKTLRVGPNPKYEGALPPDVEMYFLTVSCQHCGKPECVEVCPTGASAKTEDGTVQIDKEKCIGCQFCVMACPYNVRYLNPAEKVVEKCTLCEQLISSGGVPQCCTQCGGEARFFGDLEKGLDSFVGFDGNKAGDFLNKYSESDVYTLPDVGNKPSFRYILRDKTWRG